MSYVVTARKWRPQRFDEVVGQRHVTETLQSAIRQDRVGHAYLFSGPRGVGKTTVARIFAKALNCEHGPAEEPCNTCSICESIQSGASLDIQELDGASNNSVDDVRELIGRIGYHAAECRYKMYIIDEVHMLSNSAFNALLKTLEEPPPGVIFVFATTEPQKIPPTILSRCQRYDFHRLSVADIAGKLKAIADADKVEADEGALMLIARRATGAMRDAESIFEQLKSSREGAVTVADVNEVLGLASRDVFFGVIDCCHSGDTRGAVALFNRYYEAGGDLKEFVEGLLEHLRDLMYAGFDGGLDHAVLSDDMKARVAEQSGWYSQHDLIRMTGYVTEVETALSYAVLPVLRIEVALARMATMDTTVQLKELFRLLDGGATEPALSPSSGIVEAPPQPASAQPAQSVPAPSAHDMPSEPPVEEPPVYESDVPDEHVREQADTAPALTVQPEIDDIMEKWPSIVGILRNAAPAVGPCMEFAAPVAFDNGQLTLEFANGGSSHHKIAEANAGAIADVLGQLLGMAVTVRCVTVPNGAAKKKTTELDDLIASEPVIGTIMDLFDGEISGG